MHLSSAPSVPLKSEGAEAEASSAHPAACPAQPTPFALLNQPPRFPPPIGRRLHLCRRPRVVPSGSEVSPNPGPAAASSANPSTAKFATRLRVPTRGHLPCLFAGGDREQGLHPRWLLPMLSLKQHGVGASAVTVNARREERLAASPLVTAVASSETKAVPNA